MKVIKKFESILEKRPLHITLFDPDPEKMKDIESKVKQLEKFGTDIFFIGGSTNIDQNFLDETIKKIKSVSKIPVVLFPGDLNGVSQYADAILFMSLLNSKDPFFISHVQAKSSMMVKKTGLEIIPMAYIIVEPGMEVGKIGKAELIKRDDNDTAVGYSLAAQYMGMNLVYLEAGSGADKNIPPEMIKLIKENTDITLIVGGGIRTPKQAQEILKAGADMIVTGTITEENFDAVKGIIKTVTSFKK